MQLPTLHSAFKITFGLALSVGAVLAHAQGFAVPPQGAAGTGNSLAGAAALAEDPSTAYNNPAGMALLNGVQFAIAVHAVDTNSSFHDSGGSMPPTPAITTLGGEGGNAGGLSPIPNLYLVVPLGGNWRFGLAAGAPWGQSTEYDATWLGRFQSVKSELKSKSLNPSLSYRVNDVLSLGVGLSMTRLDVDIQRKAVLGFNTEGNAQLEGSDTALSFNAGLLWQATSTSRLGLTYRSKTDFHLTGRQDVTTATGVTIPSQSRDIVADLSLPSSFSLSLVQELSKSWRLLADFTYFTWGDLQSIPVRDATTGATTTTINLLYRDGWRAAVAFNYEINDAWLLRSGVAYIRSPVASETTRSTRQPESDRVWVSIGARWFLAGSKSSSIDFAYLRSIVSDAKIDQVDSGVATSGRVQGTYTGYGNVLSIQYTYRFH